MKVEDLQAHCVEQMRKLPKTSKMYEEHLLTLAIIDTNKKYFDEIERKDKIIEEMARFITNKDIDEDICRYQVAEHCKDEEYGVTTNVCINCIKQYFERKVEE